MKILKIDTKNLKLFSAPKGSVLKESLIRNLKDYW